MAKTFMDQFARNVLLVEYYWGWVEFASGRGQNHLYLLGIAKEKGYLNDFYRARTEVEKIRILEKYAYETLDMTANVAFDSDHQRLSDVKEHAVTTLSPLGIRYVDCQNPERDVTLLAQDAMNHDCNRYCLGDTGTKSTKLCDCRFGFGTKKNQQYGRHSRQRAA